MPARYAWRTRFPAAMRQIRRYIKRLARCRGTREPLRGRRRRVCRFPPAHACLSLRRRVGTASGAPARPHNAHTARMQHALSGPGDRYREQCIPRPQDGPGRRPDGRRQSCRRPPGRGQAPGRDAAGGRRPQGRIRGVPRTGADHVLSALLDGRRRGGRAFLREIHAQRRRAAAVRHGPGTGRGLLPWLCRTHPPKAVSSTAPS